MINRKKKNSFLVYRITKRILKRERKKLKADHEFQLSQKDEMIESLQKQIKHDRNEHNQEKENQRIYFNSQLDYERKQHKTESRELRKHIKDKMIELNMRSRALISKEERINDLKIKLSGKLKEASQAYEEFESLVQKFGFVRALGDFSSNKLKQLQKWEQNNK
jgi:hypothetical protein